jgi:hypothetical protein
LILLWDASGKVSAESFILMENKKGNPIRIISIPNGARPGISFESGI